MDRDWRIGDRVWIKTDRWGVVTGVADEILDGNGIEKPHIFIAVNVKAHDQGEVHSGRQTTLSREGWKLIQARVLRD